MKKVIKSILLGILMIALCISCTKKTTSRVYSGSVLLYSTLDEDILKAIKGAFEATYPGIAMDYYFSTLDRVNNRLAAEKSIDSFEGDVIIAGNALIFEDYKSLDYLEPYIPTEVKKIGKKFVEKENFYTAVALRGIGFNYLSDKGIKINNYADLLGSKFSDNVVMIDPEQNEMYRFFVACMMQNEKYGEIYFKNLFSNGLSLVNTSNEMMNEIISNRKTVGLNIDYLSVSKDETEKRVFSYPKRDVVFYGVPVGIFKNAINKDNAKLLVDFLLSKNGQNIFSSFGYVSVRKDVKNGLNTNRYLNKSMDINYIDLKDNIDSYVEKFNSLK